MASVNKVILIGNLGQAPDVRMTHSNMKVAEISIATTRRFTRNDEQVDLLKAAWYLNAFFTVYPALQDLEAGYMQLIEVKMSALKLCEIPTLQKAAKEPSALKFFRRLFNSCVEKLCSLGLSQDEIWENIKYNEDAYRRLFGNGNAGAFTVAHSFA